MPKISLSPKTAATAKVEALIVPVTVDGEGAALMADATLDAATVTYLQEVIGVLRLKGKTGETTRVAKVPGVAAPVVVLAGVGEPAETGAQAGPAVLERVRRGVGAAVRSLSKLTSAAVVVAPGDAAMVAAAAEGAAYGAYAPSKAGTTNTDSVQSVLVIGPSGAAAKAAIARAEALGTAVAYARDLVNLPPNLLYPQTFCDNVNERAKGGPVKVKVWNTAALVKGGFGGTLGVGMGSVNEPRVGVLTYSPSRPKARIALVGKGITFDSGGLCIKPATGMLTMKCDMAGAAAVAAAVFAIAELGLPVAVTGYLALAENMPSATAQRPSDVVTMRGGKTVEILNTDAEGRMVLGDCLALASESGPDAIVDVATLTGAQAIALAATAAVMSNDDNFRGRVLAAAETAGEQMWPMPLPDDLRSGLDSINADLAHKGGPEGGMLTAGMFLREFVGDGIPWAHLDIAGAAFNEKAATYYDPKGGTGYAVRTLVQLAQSYA